MGTLDVGKSKLGKCVLIVSELSLEALTPVINQDKISNKYQSLGEDKENSCWYPTVAIMKLSTLHMVTILNSKTKASSCT